MPDTHRVIIANEALADLEKLAGYIRQDSPQNAANVADALLRAIDSLAFMPLRFRVVGKSRSRGTPVHAMVVKPFIIYYRVDEKPASVHILNVIHGARRQPRRFK